MLVDMVVIKTNNEENKQEITCSYDQAPNTESTNSDFFHKFRSRIKLTKIANIIAYFLSKKPICRSLEKLFAVTKNQVS